MTIQHTLTLVATALLLSMLVGCDPTDKQQAADIPPADNPTAESLPTESPPTTKTTAAALPPPPSPDTSKMEPEVAERIKTARKSCEDHPASASAWGEYAMVLDVHKLAPGD